MVYNSENISWVYTKEKQLAYFAFIGFISENAIDEAIYEFDKIKSRFNPANIIFDTSKVAVINQEALIKMTKVLDKILGFLDKPKMAFTKPEMAFGEISVKKLISKLANEQAKQFENLETAEKWIYDITINK